MTDARFPERWLNDRRIRLASAGAFRQFVVSLVWSAANRTDGVITKADLLLMPFADTLATDELVDLGLYQRDGDRWLLAEFADTQITSADLDHLAEQRRMARDRKRRERARRAAGVTRDVTRDTAGQVRTGQDRLTKGKRQR